MTMLAQSLLHKSLDDVARLQKQGRVVFIVMFFSVAICILWLGHISESRPLDIQKLVLASIFFMLVSRFYVATAFASL